MSDFISNPFSTRFIAPGKIGWIGAEDFFDRLLERWSVCKFRGAIVGPHGSGKSTLLEHFVPMIVGSVWRRDAEGVVSAQRFTESVSSCAVWLQLRKSLSQSLRVPWDRLKPADLLVLDGYEQLSRFERGCVLLRTWQRGVRLLVTSHRKTALDTLCELSVSEATAREVVERLLSGSSDVASPSIDDLHLRLQQHQGNMRDVLMDLYDEVESRKDRSS